MRETLPLFPLGTVLYPGLVLPLHIFEDRYRQLVRDLLDGQEPRRFGVIAIREGRETGIGGVSALHEVGCTATVREIEEADDGRYDIVTVGTDRFRLHDLDDSRPYLVGEVEMLDDPAGDEAAAALVAASMIIEMTDRQGLLAQPDAVRRLSAERVLLARETAILRELGSTPAPDLRSSPYSPN